MTDEEQIRQVLYDFEDGGLVTNDIGKVLGCISDSVIGIGIGEQGFVRSPDEIKAIFENEIRVQDTASYSLEYDRIEVLIHEGKFANACADISIIREENGSITKSHLLQTLVFIKEEGGWKICGLHASAPALTMEDVDSYPLRYGEKMLQDMRAKIGEEAYQAEEQYRKAVLSDTIAFYIINFTGDYFEQCQINGSLCVHVEPGTSYEEFIRECLPDYVVPGDREKYMETFSLESVRKAIGENKKELSYEYQYQCPDGSTIWMVTVVRLIADSVTGEHKGIMYVKDIDQEKHRELEMKDRAERDVMTGLYNKAAFMKQVEKLLVEESGRPVMFLMLDMDHFKVINDTFGHPFGDKVLTEAGRLIRKCFGEKAVAGRLGGDEFGVFCTGEAEPEKIQQYFDELQAGLQASPVSPESGVALSFSGGATVCEHMASFHQAYQQADEALYCSKREGRGRCSFYDGDRG